MTDDSREALEKSSSLVQRKTQTRETGLGSWWRRDRRHRQRIVFRVFRVMRVGCVCYSHADRCLSLCADSTHRRPRSMGQRPDGGEGPFYHSAISKHVVRACIVVEMGSHPTKTFLCEALHTCFDVGWHNRRVHSMLRTFTVPRPRSLSCAADLVIMINLCACVQVRAQADQRAETGQTHSSRGRSSVRANQPQRQRQCHAAHVLKLRLTCVRTVRSQSHHEMFHVTTTTIGDESSAAAAAASR